MTIDRALLTDILHDCGWATIPCDKIAMLASNIQLDDVDELIRVVENLDLCELEQDAGDIGDEYWSIASSIARTLVTLGPAVLSHLAKHRGSQHEFVKSTVEMVEEALKDPKYFRNPFEIN